MQTLPLIRPRLCLALLSAGCLLALGAAFVAQYGFGLKPCHLCLLQRWPHAAVVALAAMAAWRVRSVARLRLALALCALLLAIGTGIAGYHTGVEMGIFPGPDGCTSQSSGDESIEEMRRQLLEAPLVSCDQPMGEVLGLSLAAWSALIYAFLTILASYGLYSSYSRENHD